MDGHSHSSEKVTEYFGAELKDVFLYTGIELKLVRDSTGQESTYCLAVKLSLNSIEWYEVRHPNYLIDNFSTATLPADHDPVFRLDLSDNLAVRDNLTSQLGLALHETVQISESSFNSRDNNKVARVEISQPYGYSALDIWHHGKSEKPLMRRFIYNNPWKTVKEPVEGLQLTLGRLFLDLLFDLEHTRVFENCPDIHRIEMLLLGHPVANAIYNKAKYYWAFDQFQPFLKLESDVFCKHQKTYFQNAEKEWLNVLMLKGASMTIASGNNWFDLIEDEVRRVVFATQRGEKIPSWNAQLQFADVVLWKKNAGAVEKKERLEFSSRIVSWFLARYDLDSAARCFLLRLTNSTVCRISTHITGLMVIWLVLVSLSFSWDAICKVFFPFVVHQGAQMLENPETQSWLSIFLGILCSILLGCLVIDCMKEKSINPNTRDSGPWAGEYKPSFHPVKRVALMGAVTLGSLIFIIWPWVSETACVIGKPGMGLYIGWGLLFSGLVVLLLRLVYDCLVKISTEEFWRKFFIVIRLALPRVLFALTVAWFTYVNAESSWNLALTRSFGQSLFAGALLLIVCGIYTTVKIDSWATNVRRSLGRAGLLILVAWILSLFVGVLAMGVSGKGILSSSGLVKSEFLWNRLIERGASLPVGVDSPAKFKLGEAWKALSDVRMKSTLPRVVYTLPLTDKQKFNVFPPALLFGSFLMVFVGMFFQLIFEDRHMTDPI